MLRLSKLTDYATVILSYMVTAQADLISCAEISHGTGIALPTVSKILKSLVREGLVESVRGARGGYRLERPAESISVADIVRVLEGPIAVTECSISDHNCEQSPGCRIRGNWTVINLAIQTALESVSVVDLAPPGNMTAENVRVSVDSLQRNPRQKEFGENNVS